MSLQTHVKSRCTVYAHVLNRHLGRCPSQLGGNMKLFDLKLNSRKHLQFLESAAFTTLSFILSAVILVILPGTAPIGPSDPNVKYGIDFMRYFHR